MMKKFDDMSLLEKIEYTNNTRNSLYRRLEDELIEYSFEKDYEDDGYFIEGNEEIYHGIITVDTNRPLKKWFSYYHNGFQETFNLKLIRVTKNETIGTSRVVYKVQYTYKDNPRFEEINPQTIKEYFENVYDYSKCE